MQGSMALHPTALIDAVETLLSAKSARLRWMKSSHQSSIAQYSAQPGWGTIILWGREA
jgi:hypothetical protein